MIVEFCHIMVEAIVLSQAILIDPYCTIIIEEFSIKVVSNSLSLPGLNALNGCLHDGVYFSSVTYDSINGGLERIAEKFAFLIGHFPVYSDVFSAFRRILMCVDAFGYILISEKIDGSF